MILKDYHESRKAAARWIFDRKDNAQWWGWAVLTSHNTDPQTLKLSDTVAWNIFTDLTSRGLLIPFVHNGQEVYKLDLSREDEWRRVMNPPGWWSLYVWHPAGWAIRRAVQFVLWLISLVIAVLVGSLF